MNIEERITKSKTRQFKMIISGVLNALKTQFGSNAMDGKSSLD